MSQRDLIRTVVRRVEVARDQVNIVFRVDPYPEESDPEKKVGNFVGGVVSPLLANISLHELDKFIERTQAEFTQGQRRAPHGEYRQLTNRIYVARKEATACQERGDEHAKAAWIRQIKIWDATRKHLPSGDPGDTG